VVGDVDIFEFPQFLFLGLPFHFCFVNLGTLCLPVSLAKALFMGHNVSSSKRKTKSDFKKKLERTYTKRLRAYLKTVEQNEANTPKRSTQQ